MAGNLIKLDEEIVTSAVASVTLGGSNWDSSYDVYMVQVNNVTPETDNQDLPLFRVTTSGTPQTDANYDTAAKNIYTFGTFQNATQTNATSIYLTSFYLGNATGESMNGTFYLFNFNNASEYSFVTYEMTMVGSSGVAEGKTGGLVKTTTEANDGVNFSLPTGNFAGGTFTLYGLKK